MERAALLVDQLENVTEPRRGEFVDPLAKALSIMTCDHREFPLTTQSPTLCDVMPATTDWTRPFLETLRWCRPRLNAADPSTCFRSPKLTPRGHLISDCNYDAEVTKIVNEVVARRSNLLRSENQFIDDAVACFPVTASLLSVRMTASSTAPAPTESGGYIDDWEIAPWDTWVGCWGGHVVTRVEKPFICLVDVAIAANAKIASVRLMTGEIPTRTTDATRSCTECRTLNPHPCVDRTT